MMNAKNTKLQVPEKHQAPSTKATVIVAWFLELPWILVLGAWIFHGIFRFH